MLSYVLAGAIWEQENPLWASLFRMLKDFILLFLVIDEGKEGTRFVQTIPLRAVWLQVFDLTNQVVT